MGKRLSWLPHQLRTCLPTIESFVGPGAKATVPRPIGWVRLPSNTLRQCGHSGSAAQANRGPLSAACPFRLIMQLM
jgi:hypothetical protein